MEDIFLTDTTVFTLHNFITCSKKQYIQTKPAWSFVQVFMLHYIILFTVQLSKLSLHRLLQQRLVLAVSAWILQSLNPDNSRLVSLIRSIESSNSILQMFDKTMLLFWPFALSPRRSLCNPPFIPICVHDKLLLHCSWVTETGSQKQSVAAGKKRKNPNTDHPPPISHTHI